MSDEPTDLEPAAGTDTDPQEPDKGPDPAELAKEVAKWKEMARRHEERAKANVEAAERLKELENAGKSETERLQASLDEAKSQARAATVKALKLQIAAEKGLDAKLAKFLPDVDNEIDMMQAADELLEASGTKPASSSRPKSNLTDPLEDDDSRRLAQSREAMINSMMGRSQT